MADNLRNVFVLDTGREELAPNQIGINLVKDTEHPIDPVVEVAVVTRRASGLLECEISLKRKDSLAKMAEHLTLRSNYESACENERLIEEDEKYD